MFVGNHQSTDGVHNYTLSNTTVVWEGPFILSASCDEGFLHSTKTFLGPRSCSRKQLRSGKVNRSLLNQTMTLNGAACINKG